MEWSGKNAAVAAKVLRAIWRQRADNGGFQASLDHGIMIAALRQLAQKPVRDGERLIFRALCSLPGTKEPSLGELAAAVKTEAASAAKRRSCSNVEWRIALPIHLELTPPRHTLSLEAFGVAVVITAAPRALKWFEKVRDDPRHDSHFQDHLRTHKTQWNTRAIMHLRWKSPSSATAVDEAWPVIDTVRGCFEFVLGCAGRKLSSNNRPHSWSPIGNHVVLESATGEASAFPVVFPSLSTGLSTLSDKAGVIGARNYARLKHYAALIATANEDDTSTSSLLARAFRYYANAMEQVAHSHRLLCWWQLAECLTLASRNNGDTAKVASRLAWMSKHSLICADAVEPALKAISKMRNSFVHQAESLPIHETHTNDLKLLCDLAILWLVQHVKAMPTVDHIDRALEWRNQSPSVLRVAAESIRFLENTAVR